MFEKIKKSFKNINRINVDSFSNLLTGLGAYNSRAGQTFFRAERRLSDNDLTNIYKHNGLAKRIVDSVVEDSLRSFIDADVKLIKVLNSYKVKQLMLDAGCGGRLYGGSLLVAFVDDGQEYEMPLNLNRVNRLLSFKVFDRRQVTWQFSDLSQNITSSYYGEPEVFTITPNTLYAANSSDVSFKVHRSRCFLFGGARTDNLSKLYNNLWEDSVLQACYETLKSYGLVLNASTDIVQDFVQVLIKLNGLDQKMATEGGSAQIIKRVDMMERSRSTTKTVIIDAETENYEKRASSVAGLADLWDRFSEAISSACGIPVTKLFGRSAAGLNSTGDNDTKNWYDLVRSYRSDIVEPCINWIIELVKADKRNNAISNIEWEFPSLTAPSESEWADIKKKYAEIDCMYIDRGAIDPVETWQERYKNGVFNTNINVSKMEQEPLLIESENLDLADFLIEHNKDNHTVNDIVQATYERIVK